MWAWWFGFIFNIDNNYVYFKLSVTKCQCSMLWLIHTVWDRDEDRNQEMMGFYITLCLHTTQGQGQAHGIIVFYYTHPVPGPGPGPGPVPVPTQVLSE